MVGDFVSLIMGGFTTDAGIMQLGGAGLLAINVEGAVITVPAATVTAVAAGVSIGYGTFVAATAMQGLKSSYDQLKMVNKKIDVQEAKSSGGEATANSSNAARREAMRKEGIPTSQQPKSQSKNSSGREYTYEVPKKGGGTQNKSVQQQTKDRSHEGQPHWEAGTVKTDNGTPRMNNYGRAKLENNKSKVNY